MDAKPNTTDDHEILRRIVTEWVAAVSPSLTEFKRAETALERFKTLLEPWRLLRVQNDKVSPQTTDDQVLLEHRASGRRFLARLRYVDLAQESMWIEDDNHCHWKEDVRRVDGR